MKTPFRIRTKAYCLAAMLLATCVPPLSAQETDTATAPDQTEPAALAIGDAAPDFTLPTFEDKSITLSDHFGDEGQPVILLFSRANW